MLTERVERPRAIVDFAELRAREFSRLDAGAHAYLDFTGSALYPESLVAEHAAMLREAVLGNPHSESPASLASSALLAEARSRVLRFLDADPARYGVVFTANTTGAIRLVAEGFRFAPRAPLVLAQDDHNSVNGMREYARRAGAPVLYLPLDEELRLVGAAEELEALGTGGLFAFPAQSNFSGVRHPLSLVRQARALGYSVLLDAAAYVPTSPLSLRDVPADFVALSFYKMFGYPTGLGALVARIDALDALKRPWFSGGTVEFVSVHHDAHLLKDGVEAFEDGTPSFLAIAAVCAGLDFLDGVGMERIRKRTGELTGALAAELRALRHRNGNPSVTLYGPADDVGRGATLSFNVLDTAGRVVPYCRVEERARAARVSVRGGCFCNPGAAAAAFGFPRDATVACLDAARRTGWSLDRFAACLGDRPVGAVRASTGVPTNAADLERLVAVVDGMTIG
ncbi:aminotransferase class V (plasmid) [Gemmatirosa kalamazoonensis]|uniref:Aminotransferase class V n=1 Tax=Gemmatirosa kalamazoonensis TaxID=861299 RepID=W0RQ43_9BACT|nr:aminotransferase class V-fold PLP-dependent enzyme [Gemmatirosa kalamazoonensis]AHG92460.1 aminotransferase class V [Gemmatirosa kalamazoonensis]